MKPASNRVQEENFPGPCPGMLPDENSFVQLDASHIAAQLISPRHAFDSLDRFGHRGLFGIKDDAGDGRTQLLVAHDCDDGLNPGVSVRADPEANDVLRAGGFTGASHEFVVFGRTHLEAPLGVTEAYNAGCEDRSADPAGVRPPEADTFSITKGAVELAALSGVAVAKASSRTVRLWEARALALHHLAAGDMAEALKVMAPFRRRRRG